MRTETVEIYSDQPNAGIIRNPGRQFPGLLLQGDTLSILATSADSAAAELEAGNASDAFIELDELRRQLAAYLSHYKAVLGKHGLPLPF